MKSARKLLLFVLFCVMLKSATAQTINQSILQKPWKAYWVNVPGYPQTSYGIYLFRKSISLNSKPSSYIIHVSADNRYKLYVNENLVSLGPARGDINNWNFETIDIAPYLKEGKNILAAKVWNDGEWKPEAQISLRTGFIMQGDEDAAQANTNNSWKCSIDSSYRPLRVTLPTYYVAGPGELVDMNKHIAKWEQTNYDDNSWKAAQAIFPGEPKNVLNGYGTQSGWMLVPSSLPQMELKAQRLIKLREASGVSVPNGFPSVKTAVTVPANTTAVMLLDQTFLTNAYPALIFSNGKSATISITYAEALFTKYPAKGNRDDIDGKIMMGRKDSIISDGSKEQQFTSLYFRTFRYLQLRITTKDDPLIIDDLYSTATGYPFQLNATLETEDASLKTMLEIGWRTARLCGVETYTDCPYYEQLQYIGDTRIQGLVSLYNSGDDRLLRNALNQMDNSRQPEGVTLSRHPSFTPQCIPTFSLWYIGMLHDYYMYGKDTDFVKNKLAGARQVLNYFRVYQTKDGSLKNVPHWMFTDWVTAKDWFQGVAPIGKDSCSALLDLQLLWAYQLAADLEIKQGMNSYAVQYRQYAALLKKTIREKYWDEKRQLFADRIEKDLFSQHANALAILTGMVDNSEAKAIGKKIVEDQSLAPASIYFKYYLHQALIKAGYGNEYLSWLDKWRENIKMGMTTWAEFSDINTSRSDCHAWGASPNIEFFRTVLGIDSDAPGFAKIKIEPHLGTLKNISGEIPHPNGKVSVSYLIKDNKWNINIEIPKTTTGFFVWKKKNYLLKGGKNNFSF